MSAYIILRATPHPRRVNELETRMKTVMGVMAQNGATILDLSFFNYLAREYYQKFWRLFLLELNQNITKLI